MISPEDFEEFIKLAEEWMEVFGEELKEDPMISSDQFPMLRECLRLKSQKPYDDYIKAEAEAHRIY